MASGYLGQRGILRVVRIVSFALQGGLLLDEYVRPQVGLGLGLCVSATYDKVGSGLSVRCVR